MAITRTLLSTTEGFGGGEESFVLNLSWEFVVSCKVRRLRALQSLSPELTGESSATCWWFVHTDLHNIYRKGNCVLLLLSPLDKSWSKSGAAEISQAKERM